MRTLTGCLLLLVLLVYFPNDSESKLNHHTHKRPNMCSKIESFKKTFEVPKTKHVKEYYRTWCVAIPPWCTEYRWKTVTAFTNVTVNQTRTVYDCCKGYEKVKGTCKPFCPLGCGHGECIEPHVCLCEKGWRQPDCLNECEPNRYGRGCMQNCSCLNGGICDKKDGSCSCIEGYTGPYCENPCPDNTYGKNCLEECECQNGAMCDIKDGTCDCEPGYYGEYCENECDPGSHGKDCMYECVCLNETTSACDPVDGKCVCLPGYRGKFCEHECANFTYGNNCEYECDCVNSEFCEPVAGRCICKPGWTGERCSEKCLPGTFGEDCMFICVSCHNETAVCNHVTGYCDCPPGSSGAYCETRCQEGYWGSNCSEQCKCSGNEACSPETGECTCPDGWKLPNCSDTCSSGWYGYNCSLECNCTDGNSCDATSGSCSSRLSQAYGNIDDHTTLYVIVVLLSLTVVVGIGVLIFLYKPQVVSAIRTLFGFCYRIFTRKDIKAQTSSSENRIAEQFANPLYACANDITNTTLEKAIFHNYSSATNSLHSVDLRIDSPNNMDGKSSNSSPEDGQKTDRKSTISGISAKSDDSSVGSFIRKVKENIRSSARKSDSQESVIGTKEEFAPEVLGDFKIPEDDTYENVVAVCRQIEGKEAP